MEDASGEAGEARSARRESESGAETRAAPPRFLPTSLGRDCCLRELDSTHADDSLALSLSLSLSSLRLDTRVNLFHASGLVRQRIPRHATAASRAVQVSPLLCRRPRLAACLSLPACDSDDTRATPRNHRQLESGSHTCLCAVACCPRVLPWSPPDRCSRLSPVQPLFLRHLSGALHAPGMCTMMRSFLMQLPAKDCMHAKWLRV